MTVHTADGELTPRARFGFDANVLHVRLDPEKTKSLTDPVTVTFAASPFGHTALPIDRITGIPPLGFYRFPVQLV